MSAETKDYIVIASSSSSRERTGSFTTRSSTILTIEQLRLYPKDRIELGSLTFGYSPYSRDTVGSCSPARLRSVLLALHKYREQWADQARIGNIEFTYGGDNQGRCTILVYGRTVEKRCEPHPTEFLEFVEVDYPSGNVSISFTFFDHKGNLVCFSLDSEMTMSLANFLGKQTPQSIRDMIPC